MKILYAIQATGNGHISRAQVLLPLIKKYADVDVLLSGTSSDLSLDFPVRYRLKGLSFVFGKKGGVNILKTLLKLDFWRFFKDVKNLELKNYDLIINDFEPVSAWAGLLKKKNVVALSHQYSLTSINVPKPVKKANFSKFILKYYAPAKEGYGFHFKQYEKNIFNPIIKNELLQQKKQEKNFYVVYLPAFGDKIITSVLTKVVFTNWIVFSKHTKKTYQLGNTIVCPINSTNFNTKLLNARGIICGAGFETPAEALYLNKKLLVVPMKNQYEQQCNAEALKDIGVPVLTDFDKSVVTQIKSWVRNKQRVNIDYAQDATEIVVTVLKKFNYAQEVSNKIKTSVSV